MSFIEKSLRILTVVNKNRNDLTAPFDRILISTRRGSAKTFTDQYLARSVVERAIFYAVRPGVR